MRRLLLDVNIDSLREAFSSQGHLVDDLDNYDLLDYATAVMSQPHDEELDWLIFGNK